MLRAVLVVILALGSLAALYAAGWVSAPAVPDGSPQAAAAPDAELRTALAPSPSTVEGPVVRDVTPGDMTAGPAVTGSLRRVETAPPVPPAPEPAPAPQARRERLFRPVVAAAGHLVAKDRDIRLAGVAAPEAEESCGEADALWPCGRMARAALRRFIRGRAVECEVPAGAEAIPDPAVCHVAGTDLSAWLVAQGWAKRDGERYAEAEAAARDGGLGLWAKARPGPQPAARAEAGSANSPASAFPISDLVSGMP